MHSRRALLRRVSTAIGILSLGKIVMRPTHANESRPLADAPFDHVSINVRDFRLAVDWYRDKLGMRIEHEWRQTDSGRRIAYLANGGHRTIEIIETDANPLSLPEQKGLADHFKRTGYGHVCLTVASVDATLQALNAQSVPTFSPAQTRRLGDTGYQRRIGFIQDPEGNLIELGELLTPVA